ncbi:hypothetical protein [Lactiplantibacillus carotarum]|uniref:hypothetical protein n=1 Tax=Lactiplantibacillus carotarum TaxID=2993456 RepID=UPI00298EDD46|nr:hypothetical protein [Lactiplantibacillus carotarum]
MELSTAETDYLVELLTNQLFTLLSRVTRWQTHSLTQKQYDQQVAETLTPELTLMGELADQLAPHVTDHEQFGALTTGIAKLRVASHYQLTAVQLEHANERRMNRHYRR